MIGFCLLITLFMIFDAFPPILFISQWDLFYHGAEKAHTDTEKYEEISNVKNVDRAKDIYTKWMPRKPTTNLPSTLPQQRDPHF